MVHITVAKINGEEVRYDACVEKGKKPDWLETFTYLGEGTIYSINGILQFECNVCDFYKKNL